jgi:hypothetical protein
MKALLLLLLCGTASAQILDYTGATMTGTYTSIQNNQMVTSDITGWLTAEIVVQNNILMSYSADFHGSNGVDVPLNNIGGAFVDTGIAGPAYSGPTGDSIQLNIANGQVMGANFSFWDRPYHADWIGLGIGNGDSFTYTWAPHGTCEDNRLTYNGVYQAGPPMCSAALSTQAAGTWTKPIATPEINPAGLMGALTFLGFGLAVLRARGS